MGAVRRKPQMLFHSTIRKELARSFGASLVVLVTIVMTMTLIRTLSLASRGSVNPEEVMMVMGYTVLGYLPTILTLSLFIAIVGTLSRMYRDSEMVIWFGAGRGLSALLRPLFGFAWPVLAVTALLALVVWPWANQQTQELKDRYGKRGALERLAPGQFPASASHWRGSTSCCWPSRYRASIRAWAAAATWCSRCSSSWCISTC